MTSEWVDTPQAIPPETLDIASGVALLSWINRRHRLPQRLSLQLDLAHQWDPLQGSSSAWLDYCQ